MRVAAVPVAGLYADEDVDGGVETIPLTVEGVQLNIQLNGTDKPK